MAAKLTRVTHKITIQLHVVAESRTICSSCSRRPVRKLLDTPSYGVGPREHWDTGFEPPPRNPSDGPIPHPRSPTNCLKRFSISQLSLSRKRPNGIIRDHWIIISSYSSVINNIKYFALFAYFLLPTLSYIYIDRIVLCSYVYITVIIRNYEFSEEPW
jgi:hypothetical protein